MLMTVGASERKKSHPMQELLGGLPSCAVILWLRSRHCKKILGRCGRDIDVGSNVVFEFPEQIFVGDRLYINRGSILTARATISIGDDVLIGPYSVINSGNHGFSRVDIPINRQPHTAAPISIGNNVWIGAHVTILPGVTIHDGAVIGAGAVVTGNISANQVVAGVPARPLYQRGTAL